MIDFTPNNSLHSICLVLNVAIEDINQSFVITGGGLRADTKFRSQKNELQNLMNIIDVSQVEQTLNAVFVPRELRSTFTRSWLTKSLRALIDYNWQGRISISNIHAFVSHIRTTNHTSNNFKGIAHDINLHLKKIKGTRAERHMLRRGSRPQAYIEDDTKTYTTIVVKMV